MIPDHLIDRAAAAIYASTVFGDKFAYDAWHDLGDDNQVKITTRAFARAALETVAAEIWDEGCEAFEVAHKCDHIEPWAHLRDNPYRASETA